MSACLSWFKRVRLAVTAFALGSSMIAFILSGQLTLIVRATGFENPVQLTLYRLSLLSSADFEAKIEQSLEAGDLDDARQIVKLAEKLGHQIPETLKERTEESVVDFGLRNASEFVSGAFYGDMSSVVAISGALAADYVGIGDVRDAVSEGSLMVRGEDYDQITLGLSLFGLATLACRYSQACLPIALNASFFKNANRVSKLSRPLRQHLFKVVSGLIDSEATKEAIGELSGKAIKSPSLPTAMRSFSEANWSAISKGDFSSVHDGLKAMSPVDASAASAVIKKSVRPESIDEVSKLLQSTGSVLSDGGLSAGLRILEVAENTTDLSRFSRVAREFGDQTSAVLILLGKKAISLGALVYHLVALSISVLVWIFGLLIFLRDVFMALRSE